MFIWFAQRASLTTGMTRILLVMVVAMMLAQIISPPALAATTDPQQSSTQSQEVQQPSTPPPAVEEETNPTAPPLVEETPGAPSGKPEEELQKPETTPPVIDESTADKEQGGKALENQKPEEEAANQQKADEETDKQGQTADQKNAGQNQGQDAEDQKTKTDEDAGALNQQLTPNDKKNDHDYEDGYPEYCEYPSFAYDPACDDNNYHDDDPDFEKDWYKPYYWKAVVVHDCYCWVDYAKPWYYWNHWDYYWDYHYWDYYWDYECGCWAYDYQPWYYWYSPATIYHSFYGYCYHYYYVAYFKVFAKDEKPTASGKMYDPGSKQTSTVDTQSSAV
jgi:hypothetical protein